MKGRGSPAKLKRRGLVGGGLWGRDAFQVKAAGLAELGDNTSCT